MKTGKKIKAVISEGGPGDEKKKKKKKKQNVRVLKGMSVEDREGGEGEEEASSSSTPMSKEQYKEIKYKAKVDRKVKKAKKRGINPDWVIKKLEKKKQEKKERKDKRIMSSHKMSQKAEKRKAESAENKDKRAKNKKDTKKSIKNWWKSRYQRRADRLAARSNEGRGGGGGCVAGQCKAPSKKRFRN